MNLFKVLMLSLLIGVGLTFIKDINIPYEVKCALMALTYMFSAIFCYRYAKHDLVAGNTVGFYLISVLCICMIISCWFNFMFIDVDIYNALVDIRYYSDFSWKNIYRSAELLAFFIVGRNAVIHFNYWFICRGMRINATITDNKNHKSGRQA